jgi:hypothetical protein
MADAERQTMNYEKDLTRRMRIASIAMRRATQKLSAECQKIRAGWPRHGKTYHRFRTIRRELYRMTIGGADVAE